MLSATGASVGGPEYHDLDAPVFGFSLVGGIGGDGAVLAVRAGVHAFGFDRCAFNEIVRHRLGPVVGEFPVALVFVLGALDGVGVGVALYLDEEVLELAVELGGESAKLLLARRR